MPHSDGDEQMAEDKTELWQSSVAPFAGETVSVFPLPALLVG